MRRALRAHLRDVLAIIGLILAGLFAVTVILVNQRASLPNWVPVIGSDRFELSADVDETFLKGRWITHNLFWLLTFLQSRRSERLRFD